MSAANWLRGTVKAVLSGDTIIIMGAAKGGPPPEKQLNLASIKAPRLGRRDGTTKDEPYAWDSREFLREYIIGKNCVFRIEYKVEALGGREFGSIYINKENIALLVISKGWAKVNTIGTEKSHDYDKLLEAEAEAKASGLGVWNTDQEASEAAIREMPVESFSAMELYESIGKGNPVTGIVEQVLNGNTFRITLLPTYHSVLISVVGVQSPSLGKGMDATPQPYAAQAKHFTECKILNREVRIVLEGLDRFENLFGTVYYTSGEQHVSNLSQELIKSCLAKTIEWGLEMLPDKGLELRKLEKMAKESKRLIWTNYVPQKSNKLDDEFEGTVVEVASGDTIIVRDKLSKVERKVQLSSLRAPRMGTRERDPDGWAIDAKNFLRRLLIGNEVSVKMEYTRKVPPPPGTDAPDLVLSFGNVIIKGKNSEMEINVAKTVLENGLATAIRHRSEEDRSCIYEALLMAEEKAKQEKLNMHSGKPAPVHKLNDISMDGKRAKAHFSSLQRQGKVKGIVEYVMNGHRFKIHIPKESVLIAFSPSAIKCPQRAMPARNGAPATKGEPYAEEAWSFSRDKAMQKDVELTFDSIDMRGTFLGSMVITSGTRPINLGIELLRNGYAKLLTNISSKTTSDVMKQAENLAREAKLNVWENYNENEVSVEEENGHYAKPYDEIKSIAVTVTEIIDGSTFFIQKGDSKINEITELLTNLQLDEQTHSTEQLKPGNNCIAKYTVDNLWYRGFIENVEDNKYIVYFIDYGNREILTSDRVVPSRQDVTSLPPQAQFCQLAYLKVPMLNEEYGMEAAEFLSSLINGRSCSIKSIRSEKMQANTPMSKHPKYLLPKLHVIVNEKDETKSVNGKILEEGLAKLPDPTTIKNPIFKDGIKSMIVHQDVARKYHKGIFIHGDPGDSDEEQDY